jgi:methylmalonyl-CoA/ethylmalonyl-CoA epimerase
VTKKINHVAIAVADIDQAARFYEQHLGLKLEGREHVPERRVHIGFFQVGDTRIELVQPDSADSPIAKFIGARGPGLHHICFEVDDIAADLSRLKAAGLKLIDQEPRPGAHGSRTGFLHPSAAGGALIELVQPK